MKKPSTSRRLKALIIKNITQFLRHPGGILFSIGFPIIQLLVFHYAFGHDPKDLLIGVVNHDSDNCDLGKKQGSVIYTHNDFGGICDFVDLSCRFLRDINDTTAKKVYYDYLPEVKEDLRKGKLSGIIYFNKNFTQALQRRLEDMRYTEKNDIETGEIKIWLDVSIMTTAILISDRHEGVWERSLVQGVTTSEILFSHFVVELSIVFLQVLLICCISFAYFNLDCKGSLVTVIVMVFLMGVCGLFYGFLWPIEGIPPIIKWLSYCLPTTIPGVSLRAILVKGHSVNNPEVYKGFLVIGGWTIIMILLCLYGLKRKL
ncbi:ABC transporter G family member 20-like [Vespula squamosa]|uniref:ABC transporter G family member 20-like n=1 Tax=Vespula squamosa TaxID=30214 RepID=A0ABD2AIA7_VESSQ